MTVYVKPTRSSGADGLWIWDGIMDSGTVLESVGVGGEEDKIIDTGVISVTTTRLDFETVVAANVAGCVNARNNILHIIVWGEGIDPFE